MRAGAYHTLEIEPQRPFEVIKATWDVLDIDRLKQACDPAASADLAAVLITVSASATSISATRRRQLHNKMTCSCSLIERFLLLPENLQ